MLLNSDLDQARREVDKECSGLVLGQREAIIKLIGMYREKTCSKYKGTLKSLHRLLLGEPGLKDQLKQGE